MKTPLLLFALLLISAATFAQTPADENAIKAVIEQESEAFHQRKADKALSYWAHVPYASHTYTEKGVGYVRGYEAISKAMKKVLARYPEVDKKAYKNHDYQIRITGTTAWATYITDAMEGTKKSQTYAGRYLEKANGVWKLVGVVNIPAP